MNERCPRAKETESLSLGDHPQLPRSVLDLLSPKPHVPEITESTAKLSNA
jgi:hypothetical protein